MHYTRLKHSEPGHEIFCTDKSKDRVYIFLSYSQHTLGQIKKFYSDIYECTLLNFVLFILICLSVEYQFIKYKIILAAKCFIFCIIHVYVFRFRINSFLRAFLLFSMIAYRIH